MGPGKEGRCFRELCLFTKNERPPGEPHAVTILKQLTIQLSMSAR